TFYAPTFAVVRLNADGSLDTSFGSGGLVLIQHFGTRTYFPGSSDVARAVTVDASGRIVLAGSTYGDTGSDFGMVRLNAPRSLDPGFGSVGKVILSIGMGLTNDAATGVVIAPTGKIIMAGNSSSGGVGSHFAVARLNADGSVDTSFGTSGEVTANFGNPYYVN